MDRALIIDEPWISKILSGEKTWEMRSRATTVRGRIGLIRKGSGLIVGEVDIVEVLDFNQERDVLERYTEEHCIDYSDKDREFLQKYDVAWVLENAKKYSVPIPYNHPQGAVIWVRLEKSVDWLCVDCGQHGAIPFDNGDGKVRCAACAVDRYMKMPGAEIVLTEPIFSTFGA